MNKSAKTRASPRPILTDIGRIESTYKAAAGTPKQGYLADQSATLVFDKKFEKGLRDLRVGDEVIVLTWLHRAKRNTLSVHPQGDRTQPLLGVFSTRSPHRPNPIGLHRVRIVSISAPLRFEVQGLEAFDGTPIVDVKPVLSQQDHA